MRRWLETPSRSLWRHCDVHEFRIWLAFCHLRAVMRGFNVHRPQQAFEKTIGLPIILDTMPLVWHCLYCGHLYLQWLPVIVKYHCPKFPSLYLGTANPSQAGIDRSAEYCQVNPISLRNGSYQMQAYFTKDISIEILVRWRFLFSHSNWRTHSLHSFVHVVQSTNGIMEKLFFISFHLKLRVKFR